MSNGGQDNPGSDDDQNQELRDMVHSKRGIEPGLEPEQMVPRRATRITHHEIKAMKVTVRKESSPIVAVLRSVEGICSGMLQAIGSLFSWGRVKVNPCDANGHTFPKNWKGDFPRCKHCHVVIKSPDQINPNKK